MRLRTKFIVFLGMVLISLIALIAAYFHYFIRVSFKEQILNNLLVLAEENESTYLAFIGQLKTLTINWSSDKYIKDLAETITDKSLPLTSRAKGAGDFADYIRNKKILYNKSVVIVDMIDESGTVVASNYEDRIGINEAAEEAEHHVAYFSRAITADFGQAFARNLVFEEDESPEPMFHVTTRLFSNTLDSDGKFIPLPAVLLVHFISLPQLTDLLHGTNEDIQREAITNRGFIQSFKTSEIYLVNKDRILVTPTRNKGVVDYKTYINTEPVRECFNNNNEIVGEYLNYSGTPVFGASMCLPNDGVVLIKEIATSEAYELFNSLVRKSIIIAILVFFFIITTILLLTRTPFRKISLISSASEKVAHGDFTVNIPIIGKDELGMLAIAFNTMTARLRELYANLEARVIERTRQIEEAKEKDEALFESIGEGVIASDTNARIDRVNRAAERILGWTKHELIGNILPEIVPVYDEHNEIIPITKRPIFDVLKRRVPISLIEEFSKKDGGRVPVSTITSPVAVRGKIVGTITAFRDITKEREIEKMRTDLLSLASHQLRTPLSGTKWLIETLRKGIHGPFTKEQSEYIEEIYKINERMTGLVSDMLSALRIESGIESFSQEAISASSLFDAIATSMVPVAQGKNVALHFNREKSISITTAREILRNILESFISNAIVYSSSGTEVIVNVIESEDAVTFSVKDFGIGIPKNEQEGIFGRFYRASNARAVNTRGTGLGLYISAMLAKKIGATITFESEENKGSIFYVKIPKEPERKNEE